MSDRMILAMELRKGDVFRHTSIWGGLQGEAGMRFQAAADPRVEYATGYGPGDQGEEAQAAAYALCIDADGGDDEDAGSQQLLDALPPGHEVRIPADKEEISPDEVMIYVPTAVRVMVHDGKAELEFRPTEMVLLIARA